MLFVGSTAYGHGLFQDKITAQYELEYFQIHGSRKLNLTGFMCPWEEKNCLEQEKILNL